MSISGQNITIVGAGIGGLAAALALHMRGADVTVLEQAEAITEVGAGLQISPNGVAVLRALGLQQRLAESAVRGQAVVLRDYARPGEVARLDLMRHASAGAFYFVHRADLIDLLADAVHAAGIKIRLLQNVASVDLDPAPVLHMTNGSERQPDLLIGADGLHSPTRAALNGDVQPFFTGHVAWRAVVPNTLALPNEAQLFMGPGGHLVTYPLRQGQLVNIVAVQESDLWVEEGWHIPDDPDNLRAAFADYCDLVQTLLSQVTQVRRWGLFRHPVAQRWHSDAAAILGDAAHPTLPFMAQGANMALEDAWVLASCLEAPGTTAQALARYQSLRRDRAVKVIDAANGNAWKYHLRNPLIRTLAHQVLRAGSRITPERMVRQFDWIYAHDVTRSVETGGS